MTCEELARNQYWYFYQKVIYTSFYYNHYRTRSTRINNAIIVLLVASSLAGVSGLWLWQIHPNIWALVAASLQIVSACAFLMPYAEQIWAIGHLQPELETLIHQVDHDWNVIEDLSSTEVNDLVFSYEKKLTDIEQKYIGSTYLPASESCRKRAVRDRRAFNLERFGIENITDEQEAIAHG